MFEEEGFLAVISGWEGEKMTEEVNYSGNGDNGEYKAGNDKLAADCPVTAGTFGKNRNGSDRRYRGL